MNSALRVNSAFTFALQTRLLERQHADVGRWVNTHTPPGTIVATHDIGLIGYYSQREIVDLAGLVTPEIVPILHDQQKMARFCRARGVTYLAVFTDYYETLIQVLDAHRVFSPSSSGELRDMGFIPIEVWKIQAMTMWER